MKTTIKTTLMLLLVTSMAFTSCKKDDADPVTPTPAPTLYTRLGGINAISAVIDQFLANVVADNRINGDFAATVQTPSRVRLLRMNLIDQVCQASGGPCIYKGKTMAEAHAGQNVTDADFTALVEDLIASLNQFNVPAAEQTELLTILGGLKGDIVGK